ncbi:MAG: sialate O-acetylesterase, partial [Bacteroides xylanisolvens]
IVVSAWSGSPVKAWMSTAYLSEFPEMLIDKYDRPTGGGPTYLYNSMIHPLKNYKFKGTLWYQGSADINNHEIYEKLLQRMVQNWRETFDVTPEALPFYLTQNHPYFWTGDKTNRKAAYTREAQIKAAHSIPNSGYIVALDVGKEHDNHPPDKTTIAKRFNSLVLGKTYNVDTIVYKFPEYKAMSINDNKVLLEFDNVETCIIEHDSLFAGFEVAGNDKIFYQATSAHVLNEKSIEVVSANVSTPIAVRYAFTNYSNAYIFDCNGMPAPSFRTDSFPNATTPIGNSSGIIVQWNFDNQNTNPYTGNGLFNLVGGVQSAVYNGGITPGASSAEGSSGVTEGKSLGTNNYPSQGTNPKTAGFEITISTIGYKNIQISADIRHSFGSSNTFVLQYSIDNGNTWTDVHTFDKVTTRDLWYLRAYDMSEITEVNDVSELKIRYVTDFDGNQYISSDPTRTYTNKGDVRFDNIRVTGESINTSATIVKLHPEVSVLDNKIRFEELPNTNVLIYDVSGNLVAKYKPMKEIDLNLKTGYYIVVFDKFYRKILLK